MSEYFWIGSRNANSLNQLNFQKVVPNYLYLPQSQHESFVLLYQKVVYVRRHGINAYLHHFKGGGQHYLIPSLSHSLTHSHIQRQERERQINKRLRNKCCKKWTRSHTNLSNLEFLTQLFWRRQQRQHVDVVGQQVRKMISSRQTIHWESWKKQIRTIFKGSRILLPGQCYQGTERTSSTVLDG